MGSQMEKERDPPLVGLILNVIHILENIKDNAQYRRTINNLVIEDWEQEFNTKRRDWQQYYKGIEHCLDSAIEVLEDAVEGTVGEEFEEGDIRKRVKKAGKDFLEQFDPPLEYLANNLRNMNIEYVKNHQGFDRTHGTDVILQKGFTTNQKKFLKRIQEQLNKEGNQSEGK